MKRLPRLSKAKPVGSFRPDVMKGVAVLVPAATSLTVLPSELAMKRLPYWSKAMPAGPLSPDVMKGTAVVVPAATSLIVSAYWARLPGSTLGSKSMLEIKRLPLLSKASPTGWLSPEVM